MKLNKWITSVSVMLCLCLLLMTALACKPKESVVNMSMASSFNTWLATYAIREGKINSDLVNVNINIGSDHDLQMRSGKYPMGVLNTSAFAGVIQNENLSFVAISTFIIHEGALTREGVNYLLTRVDSDINSPADLVGKKIGVPDLQGSGTSCFLALLQENYGIGADDFSSLVDFSNTQLTNLLARGDLDAALIGQNIGVQATLNPAFKVVWSIDDAFFAKFGTPCVTSMLVVDSDFQKRNPELVKAAYDLLMESVIYGEEHIDELAPLYAVEYGDGTDADFYKMIYNAHSRCKLGEISGNVYDAVVGLFSFVMARGSIDSTPDPAVVFSKP
ncbi:MAG: ABC transporter substrate-binding protein [Dehalococcoidia bacterium]|nr:ABC transporter substrate-binding protein [Dehalococcoidia bacterium]